MSGVKKNVPRMRLNYELSPGVMRFSRARMYSKRGVYAKKPFPVVRKKKEAKPKFIIKPIGGEKNGKERKVPTKRAPKFLPMERNVLKVKKYKTRKVPLRSSITPGTVLIILVGRHQGKRVVFLKQLPKSGLLLVTGPMKLNCCPLRRIAQAFVIATKTKIDISGVQIPDHIDDSYFRKANAKKTQKKGEANLFAQTREKYVVSDQRKVDQKTVDTKVLEAIRKNPERKMLFGYLGSRFSLGKNQLPHKMIF
uniref:Large ribosomal subunit protein eL6 n=1 Tax=Syphacia muris TaxID=451379 RepID=A0A0N5AJ57_9BILA